MFEIVKREHIRRLGSPSPQEPASAPQADAPGVFGKQKMSSRNRRRSFLKVGSALSRGTDTDHESNQVS